MKKNELITKISRSVGKAGLKVKKHSPELLVVGGIIGFGGTIITACRATLKVNDVIDETKETLDRIHTAKEEGITEAGQTYTEEDAKKDVALVYVQTGVKLAKLYAPAVILGGLSITSVLASNNIMRKRNAALAAAYATVNESFKKYRTNVIERFGETVDRELKYGVKAQKVEETVTDPETGKEKKVKKTIEVSDGVLASPYARFYDDGCKGWEKDPEANLFFLRAEQNFANDRLRTRGYVTLNEIYERLGIPVTKAGMSVGWVYDPENPDHKGDNYIDFGIYNINREKARDFVNGYEPVILLDFNVDGPIDELIESHQRF